MDFNKIPPSELDVMKAIWDSDHPLSSKEVIALMEEKNKWKRTTTLTLLSRLAEKNFLSTEKIKRYTYYTPLVQKKDYLDLETKLFFENLHDNSLHSLISALHNNHDISTEDLDSLEDWIKAK